MDQTQPQPSDADAMELHALVSSIAAYIDSPAFIAKAVGHDALAVARRNRDLPALRHYDKLFPTGANPRHIVAAVRTAALFDNGLPEITVEQVESHAIVAGSLQAVTSENSVSLRKIALTHPGQSDLIVELIENRGIEDHGQIMDLLAQARTSTIPLHDGVL